MSKNKNQIIVYADENIKATIKELALKQERSESYIVLKMIKAAITRPFII